MWCQPTQPPAQVIALYDRMRERAQDNLSSAAYASTISALAKTGSVYTRMLLLLWLPLLMKDTDCEINAGPRLDSITDIVCWVHLRG